MCSIQCKCILFVSQSEGEGCTMYVSPVELLETESTVVLFLDLSNGIPQQF